MSGAEWPLCRVGGSKPPRQQAPCSATKRRSRPSGWCSSRTLVRTTTNSSGGFFFSRSEYSLILYRRFLYNRNISCYIDVREIRARPGKEKICLLFVSLCLRRNIKSLRPGTMIWTVISRAHIRQSKSEPAFSDPNGRIKNASRLPCMRQAAFLILQRRYAI